MIKKLSNEAMAVGPTAGVAAAQKIFGVAVDDWLIYLALAYAVVRLLLLIPKAFGCASCFYHHRTCTLVCKSGPTTE